MEVYAPPLGASGAARRFQPGAAEEGDSLAFGLNLCGQRLLYRLPPGEYTRFEANLTLENASSGISVRLVNQGKISETAELAEGKMFHWRQEKPEGEFGLLTPGAGFFGTIRIEHGVFFPA